MHWTSPHLRYTQNNSFWHNWEMRYPAKANFPDIWCTMLQAGSIVLETHFGENFLKLIIQQFFSFLNKAYSMTSNPFWRPQGHLHSLSVALQCIAGMTASLIHKSAKLTECKEFKGITLLVWNGQVQLFSQFRRKLSLRMRD